MNMHEHEHGSVFLQPVYEAVRCHMHSASEYERFMAPLLHCRFPCSCSCPRLHSFQLLIGEIKARRWCSSVKEILESKNSKIEVRPGPGCTHNHDMLSSIGYEYVCTNTHQHSSSLAPFCQVLVKFLDDFEAIRAAMPLEPRAKKAWRVPEETEVKRIVGLVESVR